MNDLGDEGIMDRDTAGRHFATECVKHATCNKVYFAALRAWKRGNNLTEFVNNNREIKGYAKDYLIGLANELREQFPIGE